MLVDNVEDAFIRSVVVPISDWLYKKNKGVKMTKYNLDYTENMLFLAIHNGHDISTHIREKIGISDNDRMREEDPFTERFIQDKKNQIIQYTSRFEYDLNRKREKAVYQKPDDCWGLPIYPDFTLSGDEISDALKAYDYFYHEIDSVIGNFLNRYENLLIWDIHSYNHRRAGNGESFDSDVLNPEIIIGTNNNRYIDKKWLPLIEWIQKRLSNIELEKYIGDNRSLKSRTLDVRQNVKFPGGHLSQYLNSKYHPRVCCLAIEFKKIWMNEWTQEIDFNIFLELKRVFDLVCNEIHISDFA